MAPVVAVAGVFSVLGYPFSSTVAASLQKTQGPVSAVLLQSFSFRVVAVTTWNTALLRYGAGAQEMETGIVTKPLVPVRTQMQVHMLTRSNI